MLVIFRSRDPSSRPLGTFLFSHSDTLVSFLTLLGLYRDRDPLTHENYPQMRDGRKFRTSLIDPFATNVAFALLDCQEEPRERVVAMHQVILLNLNKVDWHMGNIAVQPLSTLTHRKTGCPCPAAEGTSAPGRSSRSCTRCFFKHSIPFRT